MDKFYRIAEVTSLVGVSEPTIWRRVKDGSFPAPVRVSKRAVAWRQSDLREWADNLQVKDAA